MSLFPRLVFSIATFSVLGPFSVWAADRYDIVISGGRIVDGTGAPWYIADIGIRGGKITKIGRIQASEAKKAIDAKGAVVAPGFIDMMSQTAAPLIENPKTAINLLTQGITTINAGEGHSPAPLGDADGKRNGWTTMAEYFQLLDIRGLPVNVAQSVGHTQVRRLVLGEVDRRPTADELKRMQSYVREAMQAGATGVSTALIYPPADRTGARCSWRLPRSKPLAPMANRLRKTSSVYRKASRTERTQRSFQIGRRSHHTS